MQPIRLSIYGDFWDSQVYSGKLYLFGADASILTFNWDKLVDELGSDESTRVAVVAAYSDSSLLYHPRNQVLIQDYEIKTALVAKFERLADQRFNLGLNDLANVLIRQQDNNFPFPHADTEIYGNVLYVSSDQGIHSGACNRKDKYPVITRPTRDHDVRAFGIEASYNALAVAGGREGLYEMSLTDRRRSRGQREFMRRSENDCVDCNWTFQSIFASSLRQPGFLVEFEKHEETVEIEDIGYRQARRTTRSFRGLLDGNSIFHTQGYSWGVQDKLCLYHEGIVDVVRYYPWFNEPEERFTRLTSIQLENWKGTVLGAASTLFGIVLECENALVVIPSTGAPITLTGEPVKWRVFPRSKNYENQLHVVYEDRIDILSFNHDYFVNQKEKVAGLEMFPSKALGRQS